MSNIAYVTTPGGEELAILPRSELDALRESLEHAQALGGFRAGQLPGLAPDEARDLVVATSPLAFWRRYRKQTQAVLAASVGVTQNYLSEIENGKRGGDVALWLRLARALELPVESLVDEGD
ncbi:MULTISPECIES: helix-turn-helix transcriptional regulator [unclassified Mesorhizobium]|uniref:helix-turn-helix transcriptional regulator n=1 Tax=unclassified Mesorhizobium TaxID=325217 RepID=UPI00112B6D7E|nr:MULTISPECIES: helix-turn-helix transcriptional regulator [unclassified Mesorhizobium]TPM95107.1 helix-turn-helix transcriptional regulator [Mesorhizobium sp. B2-1-3A]BCG86462.1 transcriptional regulator [Mesorhizobium sp. 113-3-9]